MSVLFDCPPVIDNAQKHWSDKGGQYNNGGTNNQVEMIKGDFFVGDTLPDCQDRYVFIYDKSYMTGRKMTVLRY